MMIFYQNKIQKVLMMIKKMVDVFAKFGWFYLFSYTTYESKNIDKISAVLQ